MVDLTIVVFLSVAADCGEINASNRSVLLLLSIKATLTIGP